MQLDTPILPCQSGMRGKTIIVYECLVRSMRNTFKSPNLMSPAATHAESSADVLASDACSNAHGVCTSWMLLMMHGPRPMDPSTSCMQMLLVSSQ